MIAVLQLAPWFDHNAAVRIVRYTGICTESRKTQLLRMYQTKSRGRKKKE